jgi:subtilisin family serine protease
MTMRRRIRTSGLVAAAGCLLPLLAAPPANAATAPRGWEAKALDLDAAQRSSKKGKDVTVAVLDTGVQQDHPALKGKVTVGPDFYKDGNGPSSSMWGVHGTAMASDVLKVAPKARILSVRVLDEKKDHQGKLAKKSAVAEGIEYAVNHGADVISMSLGGEGSFMSEFDDSEMSAIASAAHKKIPVLASAGNDGSLLNDSSYPAGYPGVMAVAATKKGGSRASFSTVRTYNDFGSPGVGIKSAKKNGGYEAIQGTSPAAALASGVVALMLSNNPRLTPAQARSILTRTAHHPSGGRNPEIGHGQIDAAAAVHAAASPPKNPARAVEYEGKKHLLSPTGTPQSQHPPMQTGMLWGGIGAGLVGLVAIGGCVAVVRQGRSRRA